MAKLNKSTSTSAKLKASGAKSSTTDRSGKQTFFSSSASGGQAIGTSSRESQKVNKITSDSLKETEGFIAPEKPKVEDVGDLAGAGNAAIASMLSPLGFTQDPNGQIRLGDILQFQQANQPQLPNLEEQYFDSREFRDVKRAQREVNDFTSQLNSLQAQSQAQQLSLEGQGRGQTSSFIGGEQARINREAAIAALPIQAQLSASQGNLEFAQKQLDTVFTLRSQDAQNRYKLETDRLNSIVSFLNQAETRQYNARMQDEERKYSEEQRAIQMASAVASDAIAFGQSGLLSQLATAKTPEDVFRIQAQLRKPASGGDTGTWSTFADGTKKINSKTGEVVDITGGTAGGDARNITESTAKLDALLGYASKAKELSGASGLGLYNRAATFLSGDSDYNRLANLVDTMKVNLLTINTDPTIKKFFGPQMSNRDTELMTSAGTTLNAERQSPKDMKSEIEAYESVIKRAKGWTYLGGGGVLTVELTDPVTGLKQYTPVNYDTLEQAIRDGVLVKF